MVGHLCAVMWSVLILQGIQALACILQINLSGTVGKKAKTFASLKNIMDRENKSDNLYDIITLQAYMP
jgi:hypothetical protein